MLKKLHLCFSCFKTNHVSSECRSRSTCDKCSKQCHTQQSPSTGPPQGPPEQPQPPFTDESAHSNATSTVNSTAGVLSSATTCRIVPVVLYQKDNPSNEVKTYALLDDARDTTFITNKIIRSAFKELVLASTYAACMVVKLSQYLELTGALKLIYQKHMPEIQFHRGKIRYPLQRLQASGLI